MQHIVITALCLGIWYLLERANSPTATNFAVAFALSVSIVSVFTRRGA